MNITKCQVLFFVLLLVSVEIGFCWFLKIAQDLLLHNQVYVTKLADIFQIGEPKCSYYCDLHTERRANLRKYNRNKKSCECFYATEDFTDSRELAPELNQSIFLANPELFEKKLYLATCKIQVTPEHAVQIAQAHDDDFTKDECLEKVAGLDEDESFAVYCEENSFCGWNLQPNATESLKYLTQKTCQVFVNNVTFCEDFNEQLVQADVDECLRGGDNLCGNNSGTCENIVNRGYECSCYAGYEIIHNLEEGTVYCEDIDECGNDINACDGSYERCENVVGSFNCVCESDGFERVLPGSDCRDIDECQSLCKGDFEVCENQIGNFSCECFDGYERKAVSVKCTDIDECSLAEDVCPGPFDYCLNGPGNFTCPCESSGFKRISSDYNCSDVDECQTICMGEKHDSCSNSVGSFSCSCKTGFKYESPTDLCVDIDECEENIDGCELTANTNCLNVDATFYCVPHNLDSPKMENYTSEGFPSFQICTEDPCICDEHYMLAFLNNSIFCMNMFFSEGGVHNSYPKCLAPCCSSFCGWIQPVDGFSSSAHSANHVVENMWDSSPDVLPVARYFHTEYDPPLPHWVDLDLGGTFSVNSVSILAYADAYTGDSTVAVCKERNVDCVWCGTVLEAKDFQWIFVLCEEEIAGSWLRMERQEGDRFIIMEVLIHYSI